MPTYAYRCAACGHAFEQFQRMTDEPLTECPECGGGIKRVIFPVGVVFKGSGWYINDSRKKSGSDETAKTDEAKTKKDDGGSSATGDTKSDTKSDTKEKSPAAKPAAD